jgi:transcription termination factor NusB
MARTTTSKLLQLIEDGALDKDIVIQAFCDYLSEDDIKDFVEINEFVEIEPEFIEDFDEDPIDEVDDFRDDDYDSNY